MTGPSKPDETRALTVRWPGTDFELIEEAARVLAQKTQLPATPTDVIRQGGVARAKEILAEQSAA